ncbi:hypothetical protein HX92_4357 [Mycobacterium tuberculosis]|uniref:Uncharacterized protein n=1 Tax=Mycobacterium tuberculosis TaxID=1773 RepID=A0A0Q3YBU8_MYCTX|nr:hypothetical protein BCGT_2155 [Mycobacterium tuberculosis variant bovis BCG str. ATCC 35743]AIB48991.1 hypothetical protein MTBK_24470 [Mycobacterium tuberculosis K]ALA78857.1 Uncharacterized protein BCGR_2540 [Mycobacterium tuberculosis variant bovis BCG]AOZ43574.1 hypothetical protein BTB1458_2575 [Mycobacterium tuberculosis]EQM22706.1 hypothetical protein FJ05194_1166 [Mycobacterium tuberculosis FJ05194]EQM24123.1 hypothetical protein GuangZ0019_0024 [Mycobacterium tuberculosis GuangZ00
MSNAAPLAVWVGSMRPKTQRESLGGSCCWSCPDHPDYSERPMRAG